MLIENKPGAGAMIATEYVARSEPDGYTLLLASPGAITVNPVVMAKINYSPTKDFAPISMIASFPLMLVADPKLPIRTVADVVSYAKAHPDQIHHRAARASPRGWSTRCSSSARASRLSS